MTLTASPTVIDVGDVSCEQYLPNKYKKTKVIMKSLALILS